MSDTEPEHRCQPGQATEPTPSDCNRHPSHHYCIWCDGWYGVPHDFTVPDTGKVIPGCHSNPDGHTPMRPDQCVCMFCQVYTEKGYEHAVRWRNARDREIMFAEWHQEEDRQRGFIDPADLAELRATATAALGDGKSWSVEWDTCDCSGGFPCSHGMYVYRLDVTAGHLEAEPDTIAPRPGGDGAPAGLFDAACRHAAVFDPPTVLALLDRLERACLLRSDMYKTPDAANDYYMVSRAKVLALFAEFGVDPGPVELRDLTPGTPAWRLEEIGYPIVRTEP